MQKEKQFAEDNGAEDARLLIDMDGTLAKFTPVETLELLYEEGYFRNLEPLQNVVDAIKEIIRTHPEKQIYVMSSVLSDSRYALLEKNEWLDQYLPEVDLEHRIFPPCGENKLDYVPGGIRGTDHLLDDYTHNLVLWEPPAKGIKLLNGINHTKESWSGNMLRYDKPPKELAQNIVDILESGITIKDGRPLHQHVMMANQSYDQGVKTGYISEEQKNQMVFLTEEQAEKAIREGIHICCLGEYPEYQGIHAEKYQTQELGTRQDVAALYHSSGSGIVHKACVSPYYENAAELKEMLQKACERGEDKNKLKKDLSKKPQEIKSPKL